MNPVRIHLPAASKRCAVRLRNSAQWLVILLAIASSSQLRAQFKQPTEEELKMTADPKAPGAAAVFLSVDEVTDDSTGIDSTYERIKILGEKGKELATVEIPHLRGDTRITDIKGRTIHADGTVVPLIVKPEDLLAFKAGSTQVDRMVFTFPSVELGSILEFRYLTRHDTSMYSSPHWDIQRAYFIHQAHFGFTPFPSFMHFSGGYRLFEVDAKGKTKSVDSLMWWKTLPPGADIKSDAMGRMSLDATDIPPIADEEWMPPVRSVQYKVQFYYLPATNFNDFWTSEAKDWSKDLDHFAEPTKRIKEAVAGIVAIGDSDLDKAKKIYNAVQALDNTDFSRKKEQSELKQLKIKEARRAEDTWSQKSGSSEDIAQLYIAMTRAAGLTVYAMKVADRDKGAFDPTYMNFDQLETTLAIVVLNGKEAILDPGEKLCPFQTLSWKHSNAYGIRESAAGPNLGHTPSQEFTANSRVRTGEMDLDARGAITGVVRLVITGQEALRWRQLALENDLGEVKKQFDQELGSTVPEGVEAHVDHFLDLDDPDSSLMAIVNVQGSLGTATSKRLLLPGFFFQTRANQPFINQEKRQQPVDMHYGEQVTDQIVYHLPAGFSIEGVPQDRNDLWPAHAAYVVTTTSQPGKITVVRKFARAFTQAKAEEYADLRMFYQKVASADQQQIVLTTSTSVMAGKGN